MGASFYIWNLLAYYMLLIVLKDSWLQSSQTSYIVHHAELIILSFLLLVTD